MNWKRKVKKKKIKKKKSSNKADRHKLHARNSISHRPVLRSINWSVSRLENEVMLEYKDFHLKKATKAKRNGLTN